MAVMGFISPSFDMNSSAVTPICTNLPSDFAIRGVSLGIDFDGVFGSLLIGTVLAVLLFGMLLVQIYFYFEHYASDSSKMKIMVSQTLPSDGQCTQHDLPRSSLSGIHISATA